MNYLIVKNRGLIEPKDLYLIGSSTKRGDETKIGMFGSGWKFAMAWLMRNDCMPIICSGDEKIDVDFNITEHRDNPIRIITINGKETSLTSGMGIKWTGWMALREIISNAIDEGDHSISTAWNPEEFKSDSNMTTIYIPMNNELSNVMRSYNEYFSYERTVFYENEVGRVYLKSEPTKIAVYRKGIRCYDSSRITKTDFDFNNIEINESRLTHEREVKRNVQLFLKHGVKPSLLKHLIQDNLLGYLPQYPNEFIIKALTELVNDGEVVTCPTLQGIGGMFLVQNPTLVVPNKWYNKLADLGLVPNPFEKFAEIDSPENFIRTDKYDWKEVEYYLKGLNLNYEFVSGLFEKELMVSGNKVWINDKIQDHALDISARILYLTSTVEFKRQMK